eukprot:Rhum_TRINITY_DN13870_c0_g1::Rhum_TRINITY_DN13870_c0_g1_i4::g.65229::m.65229
MDGGTTLSAGQLSFFLGYSGAVLLWVYAEYLARNQVKRSKDGGDEKEGDVEAGTSQGKSGAAVAAPPPLLTSLLSQSENPVLGILMLSEDTLLANRTTLRAMAEFGLHMMAYYVCDRTTFFPEPGKKHYSRDLFWFIYSILIAYNVAHHVEKGSSTAYLNRDQTEEWKGWMQVLFLMYHYFNAGEQYNSIRLYIAAYVWMTGFGNFSFYYVRKDFSPARFFQMLWRLNFLVFWVCVVMNNDYMLYYICPMHTIWTVFVYFILRIGNKYNDNGNVIMLKVALSVAVVYVGWANADAFYAVWRPLSPLVQYVDPNPKNPGLVQEPLHEWFFRSGLDRYVWIFGMLCANFHPTTEKFLLWMDSLPQAARFGARSVFTGTLLTIGVYWYRSFMVLDRREYNTWHPYTSFIPIGIYILLRNLTPTLREWSLTYFSFLGKITLETYIGQFHIWLHTGVANGQPRTLLTLVPDYPLMNFFVVTPLYLWISYRLFHLTNTLKLDILPSKDNPRLYRNLLLTAATWTCIYICGRLIKSFA